MVHQLPDILYGFSGISYGAVGIIATIVTIALLPRRSTLDAFPTVGSSAGFLGCWWGGIKFMINATEILQQGYEKHKSAPFKVADKYGWMVIMSSRRHVEELARATDDDFSFVKAARERLNTDYTFGREIREDPDFPPFLHSRLTRNIESMYPEIKDEIVTAFDEVLDLTGDEWKIVPASSSMEKIIGRASNRIFVGLPLCRDPEWLDLNVRYAIDIALAGEVLGLFPKFLKPLAACFFPNIPRNAKLALKHVSALIEERSKHSENLGGEAGDPKDLISWSIDDDPEMTLTALVTRILVANFASLHTASVSFTHALLFLAANPQYIQLLREEVESIVDKEGWSKVSVSKMHKLDSFLKESQRLEGLNSLTVMRKALKNFTFSDGTFVPEGTLVGVPVRAIHHDEKLYENAKVFEPFRYAGMREEDRDSEGMKCHYVSTAFDYLGFGHGRHACPGRFFAAIELKTMLAHIVATYDVKLQDNTTRPRSLHIGTSIIPNPNATVLFRKRVDEPACSRN